MIHEDNKVRRQLSDRITSFMDGKVVKIEIDEKTLSPTVYLKFVGFDTDLSYGGEHDPDTVAFKKMIAMLNAADEEAGKGYYRLAGETVCFKRRVHGKPFMYVLTSTKAFKSYVGETRYFQAWLRSSLIEPTKDGKPTHSVRGMNNVKKVRCVMIPLKDHESKNELLHLASVEALREMTQKYVNALGELGDQDVQIDKLNSEVSSLQRKNAMLKSFLKEREVLINVLTKPRNGS